MNIYTRGGDAGMTSDAGGRRERKDAPRPEANGTVDELNALVGVARSTDPPADVDRMLLRVQNDLLALGAQLARPQADAPGTVGVGAEDVTRLEEWIDSLQQDLPPLKSFILPGGGVPAAVLQLARTVCRRAERRVVALTDTKPVAPEVLAYLNRLSDLLFVMARRANVHAGQPETPWK